MVPNKGLDDGRSIFIFGGVVLGRNDQTTTFACSSVHRLNNIYEFLFVCQGPVDLVVVTRPKIDHDVLVSEEEHDSARIVQLVHSIEIRHLRDVHQVYDTEVFNLIGNVEQRLVHFHARLVAGRESGVRVSGKPFI